MKRAGNSASAALVTARARVYSYVTETPVTPERRSVGSSSVCGALGTPSTRTL